MQRSRLCRPAMPRPSLHARGMEPECIGKGRVASTLEWLDGYVKSRWEHDTSN